jgi:two-component system, NarL family, sensor histidine kinase EvgS
MSRLFRLAWVLTACIAAVHGVLAAPAENLTLTAEERAWLDRHPVIRVGYDPDFRPFCFRDAQGVARGIDPDLFAVLERRLGVRFELQTAATWTSVYEAAVQRKMDVLSSTADLPERRAHFLFTRAYVRFPVTIVTRNDGPFAVTTTDLQTMRVAGARNYAPTLAFQRTYPGVRLKEFETIDEALAAVSRQEADAAVTNLANASYIIKTRGLANLKIAGVVPEFFEERLAVRNDWPELATILDHALAALPPPEMDAILDRWIKVDYAAVIRWDVVRRWAIIGTVFALTVIGLATWRNLSLRRELAKRLVVMRDLEATNARLNRANTELERRHEEKTELMRMAAHDLRSPLGAIMLAADTLREDPSAVQGIEMIATSARQMAELIDNLLEVHALEEGKRVFREAPLAPDKILLAAAATLDPAAQRKQITIDVSAVQATADVIGDAAALRQIFENLISNAVKFSPPGRCVRLATVSWGEFVRVEVRDQGPGVPSGERERIFTKYARGSALPTAGERSTGLGLAIVRDLVAVMNGRVWCENLPEGGATFVVALARHAPDETGTAQKAAG